MPEEENILYDCPCCHHKLRTPALFSAHLKSVHGMFRRRNPLDYICDSADDDLRNKAKQLEWLWANCKIVYWPKVPEHAYPVEHAPGAGKNSRGTIEAYMREEHPLQRTGLHVYACGTEHAPDEYGMWWGPSTDLQKALGTAGTTMKDVIVDFAPDSTDKIVYRWDTGKVTWVKEQEQPKEQPLKLMCISAGTNAMFTAGTLYTITRNRENIWEVRDNIGHTRCVSKCNKRLIVGHTKSEESYFEQPVYAHFKLEGTTDGNKD